ncbi:MAG: phage replisome organizer N-terminal domain-containing protein [Clostridiales bacterium]|jgi:predicted phage replisome organizer|nr:phage replisome organizer N-terminal domain-containing protein [Clostridiales bacterium]MDD7647853.1 phage replisome organizer N-terminal domain-containing protein [Ruminococcus bromii]
MANKRYYWLKLYDDFFSSLRIKKLRKLAGGDTYLAIYLKMQLLAMKSDGILKWSGLEDDFTSELALELDEEPENIKVTLAYLLSCGLAETDDSINYFFPFAVSNVGSESTVAQRVRDYRKKAKEEALNEAENNAVTPLLHCNTEKEIEKDTRGKRQEEDIEADVTAPNGAVCRTGDVRRVVEAWNSLGINPIMKITGSSTRSGMLRARISEYGVDAVINAIAQINDSSFLKGQNKSGWTVSFDWFVRPNNFLKVMEGRYSDSPHGSQPTHNGVPVDYGSPEDFYK